MGMAGRISVDTGKVEAAADRISTINRELNRDFGELEKAIQRLNNHWNSRASSNVIGKFHHIKDNLKENRFMVMENYRNFLYKQISDGYQSTETHNISLADAFK
jgi:hypothetical protein